MRTYTKEFIKKDWDELTADQREEVRDRLFRDDAMIKEYVINEREMFNNYIDEIKDMAKDLYDVIDLDWSTGNGRPHINRRGWTVDLHEYPSEFVDLSDVGIDEKIKATIYAVYPAHYAFVVPELEYIGLKFDYSDDLGMDESELKRLFEKSVDGKAFLNKWAIILSAPLDDYWETCKEYTHGFQDIDEWLKTEMTDGDLRAVYSTYEDGNEVFEKFIWE